MEGWTHPFQGKKGQKLAIKRNVKRESSERKDSGSGPHEQAALEIRLGDGHCVRGFPGNVVGTIRARHNHDHGPLGLRPPGTHSYSGMLRPGFGLR